MFHLTPIQTALAVAIGLIAFYVAMRTAKVVFKILFWGIALAVAAWAVLSLLRP